MKKILLMLVMVNILCLICAGCGPLTVSKEVANRGVDINAEHSLLNLNLEKEPYGKIEGSAVGIFFFGGIDISGEWGEKQFIGFVASFNNGQVGIFKFPVNKFDFVFDDAKTTPVVKFRTTGYSDGSVKSPIPTASTTELIGSLTDGVEITISKQSFSEDISILKYTLK